MFSTKSLLRGLALSLALSTGTAAETARPVLNVHSFGAAGDGTSDDWSAIQATLDAAGKVGGIAQLGARPYLVARPLTVPSGVLLRGWGDGRVSEPPVTSSSELAKYCELGVATPVPAKSCTQADYCSSCSRLLAAISWPERHRAMVNFVGNPAPVTDAGIEGVLLDHRGRSRAWNANTQLSTELLSSVLVSNAKRITIRGVTSCDGGYATPRPTPYANDPFTPQLLLYGREDNAEYSPLSFRGSTVGASGSVEDIIVDSSRFFLPLSSYQQFAIRAINNFWDVEPKAPSTIQVSGLVVTNSVFSGNYYWNTIELAGRRSTRHHLENNLFCGRTLAHVDFDKGASYGTALRNRIVNAGMPHLLLPLNNVRASGISDHSNASTFPNVGNTIVANVIENVVNPNYALPSDPINNHRLESGIYLEYVRQAQVTNNVVTNVNHGRSGFGILVGQGVQGSSIHGNRIGMIETGPASFAVDPNRTPGYGISGTEYVCRLPNGSSDEYCITRDNSVKGNTVVAKSVGIRLYFDPAGSPPSSHRNWTLESNSVQSLGNNVPTIYLTPASSHLNDNITTGGSIGYVIGGPGSRLCRNHASAPSVRGFQLNASLFFGRNNTCQSCPALYSAASNATITSLDCP